MQEHYHYAALPREEEYKSSPYSSSRQLGTYTSSSVSAVGDIDLEAQIRADRDERIARRMMVVVKLLILLIMVIAPLVGIVRGVSEEVSSARLVTRGWKNLERNDQLAYIIALSLCGGFAFLGLVGAAYWVNKRKSGDDEVEESSGGVDASEGQPRKGLIPIWAKKWLCL